VITPALALAVLIADLQAQLADARADIEALCEGVCAARSTGLSAAAQVRMEITSVLRSRPDGDICDYSDEGSVAGMDAAIDALEQPPVIPYEGHPDSVTGELDADDEDAFIALTASITEEAS
jgi:hypothetical protein